MLGDDSAYLLDVVVVVELAVSHSTYINNAIIATLLSEDEASSAEEFFLEASALNADSTLRRNLRRPPRFHGYIETIVNRFNVKEFKSNFRMNPVTAEDLENRISSLIVRQRQEGRSTISPRGQILPVLWLLATPDSYRSIGQQFGLSKSSLHHCFRRVYKALNEIAHDAIHWPTSMEKPAIKQKFQQLAGLPDVIGAVDGCQIEIDAPEEHPAAYRTGKKKHAIQLQAVCTAELIFTDVFAGYPGSVHDARVLRNSPLLRDAPSLFEGNDYILGDKAYPLMLWCIPPYKNLGNMSGAEVNFNRRHSKTRQVIERTFALLKGRFRRLKHLPMFRTDEIAPTIVAACVLHNICLQGIAEEQDIEEYIVEGRANPALAPNAQDEPDEPEQEPAPAAAVSKRNYLRDLVLN